MTEEELNQIAARASLPLREDCTRLLAEVRRLQALVMRYAALVATLEIRLKGDLELLEHLDKTRRD